MDRYSFRIDSKEFNLEKETLPNKKEASIFVMMSPYSVPMEARTFYNEKKKIFTLEYKFIDHSPKRKKIKFGDCVTMYVGNNCHVPYEIEVNVGKIKEGHRDSNFKLGHTIYMLLMNALEIYNFSKFDERDDPSKLEILYLRDNWVKLIYKPLGGASLEQ